MRERDDTFRNSPLPHALCLLSHCRCEGCVALLSRMAKGGRGRSTPWLGTLPSMLEQPTHALNNSTHNREKSPTSKRRWVRPHAPERDHPIVQCWHCCSGLRQEPFRNAWEHSHLWRDSPQRAKIISLTTVRVVPTAARQLVSCRRRTTHARPPPPPKWPGIDPRLPQYSPYTLSDH